MFFHKGLKAATSCWRLALTWVHKPYWKRSSGPVRTEGYLLALHAWRQRVGVRLKRREQGSTTIHHHQVWTCILGLEGWCSIASAGTTSTCNVSNERLQDKLLPMPAHQELCHYYTVLQILFLSRVRQFFHNIHANRVIKTVLKSIIPRFVSSS